MLTKLENLACFVTALLALIIEACFVYCIRVHPFVGGAAEPSFYSGQWISPTSPQCWLLGALVVLFYYLCRVVQLDPQKAVQSRRTFLRIWYWFLALAWAQGCALYLNYFALVRW